MADNGVLLNVLLVIFGGVVVSWIIWVSSNTVEFAKQKKDVDKTARSVELMISEFKASFAEMREEYKAENDKTNKRFDLFMKTELDELKSIIRERE